MQFVLLSSTGALSGLVARLRQSGVGVTVGDTPEMVSAATRRRAPDAVLVELMAPGCPGARLLEDLAHQSPHIFRIGLAPKEGLGGIMCGSVGAQRLLSWREGVRELISAAEDMRRVRSRLPHAGARALLGRVCLLPAGAGALARLKRVPEADTAGLVEVLRGDPVLAAQVLRWGLNITPALADSFRPLHGAVDLLGPERTRRALLELPWPAPRDPDFELEAHCEDAAQSARLALALQGDAPSEEAYLVSLLASIGRLTMSLELSAANIGHPGDPSLLAFQRKTLGFDVAQLGAALMDLWGFPERWAGSVAAALEPAKVPTEEPELTGAVHVAGALVSGAEVDAGWLRTQSIPVDTQVWEGLLAESRQGRAGPQASAAAPPEDSPDNNEAPGEQAPGRHTPASMTVMIGLARTLVSNSPERFVATGQALALVPALAAELDSDQDVFVVSVVMMALLQDLQVGEGRQRALFESWSKGAAERTGAALALSFGPTPEGRESEQAVHMLRALMRERSGGQSLGAAREAIIRAHDYPYGIADVLMAQPTPGEVERTPLWALEEGMVVGEDVLDEEGRLLAGCGQVLTDRVANAIQRQAAVDSVLLMAS